jgi:hypothetical protein
LNTGRPSTTWAIPPALFVWLFLKQSLRFIYWATLDFDLLFTFSYNWDSRGTHSRAQLLLLEMGSLKLLALG